MLWQTFHNSSRCSKVIINSDAWRCFCVIVIATEARCVPSCLSLYNYDGRVSVCDFRYLKAGACQHVEPFAIRRLGCAIV